MLLHLVQKKALGLAEHNRGLFLILTVAKQSYPEANLTTVKDLPAAAEATPKQPEISFPMRGLAMSCRFHLIILAVFVSVSQALASDNAVPDDALLTSDQLRQAMTGERFAYRGQFREGAAAEEFAEGYISAIAERSSQRGLWCGFDKIKPHQLLALIFESLPASTQQEIQDGMQGATKAEPAAAAPSAQDSAAADQISRVLELRLPCN